ncbi:MAG: hypothetical protein P4L57_15065, partial [Rhizomicrobium sp.]|nr:hypothetical protein [Rhizomicrobium sp.]
MRHTVLRRAGAAMALAFACLTGAALGAPPCTGTYSNGVAIAVKAPVYMPDVGYVAKGKALGATAQTSCDVFTFAWNQFLYYTQAVKIAAPHSGAFAPRFLTLAPWYNVLKTDGSPQPGAYPGGPTDLRTAKLDQGQAGDDDHLLDVAGNTVRYDIRFDSNMYQSIVLQNLYTEALFTKACVPDPSNNGTCKNNAKIWMTPSGANEHPEPGALEVKTAWRDFGSPAACPATQFYCNGRFGLVGFHYVNKTFSHGEWIWASFEHVSNDPDCAPTGDTPIAPKSPLGTAWSFFNPASVPPAVMASKICSVTAPSPQCNTNPVSGKVGPNKTYKAINVCRTLVIAPGGASAANCKVMPPGSVPGSDNGPGNVACLNATIMPQLTGVWKNYKLIGAVWTKGGMGPNTDFRITTFQVPPP